MWVFYLIFPHTFSINYYTPLYLLCKCITIEYKNNEEDYFFLDCPLREKGKKEMLYLSEPTMGLSTWGIPK